MSDTITVRDHTKPCEHGHNHCHRPPDDKDGLCDGGREIVLRWRQHYWYEGSGENGDISGWRVPVTEDEVFWVEVSDE